jgi:hypothetical protein
MHSESIHRCAMPKRIVKMIVSRSPLMGRPDLDTLFTLYCGRRELPEHESENASKVTDDIKAQKLWRVLRPLSGYHAPWDWNWPLSGDPRQIADDFHAVVSRAVFGVPLFDFVKCALGYNSQALSVDALLNAACDARNSLQRVIQGRPQTKDTYVKSRRLVTTIYRNPALTRRGIVVTVPPVSSLDRCQQLVQHNTCPIRCLGLDPRPDQEPVHNTQPRFRTQETCGSRRI